MATKNEIVTCTVIFGIIGAIIGYNKAKQNNIIKEEKWKYSLKWGIGGAFCGFTIAEVFGSPNDTVNYQLYHNRKRVYHGITYYNRIENRRVEHIMSGKVFTKMKIDNPKPRVDALELEKVLICKHKPIYNIQHNS